jgi:hypothetical protein
MNRPAEGLALGRIRNVSTESKKPGMHPTPEEGVRLIRAFASVRDGAMRAAIVRFVLTIAEESARL